MANNTPVNQTINSSPNTASTSKQINKPLRYGVLFGWFFTLFIAVTSTGLVTYYKVVKPYLAKDTIVLATPTPSPSPEIVVGTANLLEEAKTALQTGNTEQALEKLAQFIQVDTTNAEAYKLQADALVSSNRYEEAIESYQKTISLDRENLDAYQKMGQACEQIGKDDLAITTYTSALIIKSDPNIQLALAKVLVRNNRSEEARKNFEIVAKGEDLALATLAKQELTKLADSRLALNKPVKTPTPIASPINTPIIIATPSPEPVKIEPPPKIETPKPVTVPSEPKLSADDYIRRGSEMLNAGNTFAALRDFDKALKTSPSDLKVYYLIGQAYHRQGNLAAALNAYKRCSPPAWQGTYSGVCANQVKMLEKKLK